MLEAMIWKGSCWRFLPMEQATRQIYIRLRKVVLTRLTLPNAGRGSEPTRMLLSHFSEPARMLLSDFSEPTRMLLSHFREHTSFQLINYLVEWLKTTNSTSAVPWIDLQISTPPTPLPSRMKSVSARWLLTLQTQWPTEPSSITIPSCVYARNVEKVWTSWTATSGYHRERQTQMAYGMKHVTKANKSYINQQLG